MACSSLLDTDLGRSLDILQPGLKFLQLLLIMLPLHLSHSLQVLQLGLSFL